MDMGTNDIIKEIERLPVQQRIYVIEKAIHSIPNYEEKHQKINTERALLSDYGDENDLPVFSDLDLEDLY